MFGLSLLLAVALAAPAASTPLSTQPNKSDAPPAACLFQNGTPPDYQACVAATPEGSMWRNLALINLATAAFLKRDVAEAVRLYDAAKPPEGLTMTSDPGFHAFRGSAYTEVGRREEGLEDARTAAGMLSGEIPLPQPFDHPEARRQAYTLILPILHAADDPAYAGARSAYDALPVDETSWFSLANRAAVLEQLGEFDAALDLGRRALALDPESPGLLNNYCYTLVRAGQAAEGLPYCQRAVGAAPDMAPLRHSLASALAALGRCEEAETELAAARRLDAVTATYQQPIPCK